MVLEVKSSNGITTLPIDSRLMSMRRIFIEDDIDDEAANDFMKKILLLNIEDSKTPIDVLINSNGGEINAGLAIYDVIQGSEAPVRMICVGKAYSMAAVLLACGNYGRYILPNSEVMLHEPLLGNRVGGNSSSIKCISDSLLETKKKINKIIAKHTGKTEKEVEKATGFDHYFTPKESVKFGLCDKIVMFDEIIKGVK